MANISATTTIDTIIKDFQHITGRGDGDYYRLFQMVVRALQDIYQFHAMRVVQRKEYNLADLTNGVLPYPQDCIGVIGIEYNRSNRLYPASHKLDIIYGENASGSVSYVAERDDSYVSNYGKTGGRNLYYYTDDKANRRLIFDAVADEKIWLKYVSTGIDADLAEDTVVPKAYVEFIENYIMYKEASLHRRGNKNAAMFYWEEYKKAARRLKTFQGPSLEELKDAIYDGYSQGPKR